MKKATLGRGLDALIPKESKPEGLTLLSINEIRPNALQPRKDFDDETITELTASIKEKGILQPIVVRQAAGGYEIIAGERRWRAAQRAGVVKVPVVVKDASDMEALELALIENLQREDLNPIEEASGYQHLIEVYGLTHEEVSLRIGKDRSTVTNQLRLLRLSDEAKRALIEEEITAGHARALLGLESLSDANVVLHAIRKKKLSVRMTETLIRNMTRERKSAVKPVSSDPYLERLADDIKGFLSTQVRIIYNKGKGRIEIDYYSDDELERLVSALLGK
ncbi:MAG TPA: ParB/RepB/Spo0J family partition protein [Thermodesulfobacteriota bacterium]|nr:ParB/RepB/Spo0J family partition protein [Thermodesulfobacteriota bacterium]